MRHSERYTVVVGKGYRPRLVPLGKWAWPAWGFVGFYFVFAAVLPLLILVWSSLLPYYRPPSWKALSAVTLENYWELFASPALLNVAGNTLLLGGISSVAIMFLAILCSWFVYRTNITGRKVLDVVVFLPYAVSGMVIGVAFLVVFLSFPNPLYNTIWIIVLAYVVNYLPIGTRFTNAAVVQVHKELEEAAWGSGAGFWTTLRFVWFPLLLPGAGERLPVRADPELQGHVHRHAAARPRQHGAFRLPLAPVGYRQSQARRPPCPCCWWWWSPP